MKKIILATVLAGIGSTAALAADLGARTYTKAPAMVDQVYNWTGFYVGGDIGAAHQAHNLSRTSPRTSALRVAGTMFSTIRSVIHRLLAAFTPDIIGSSRQTWWQALKATGSGYVPTIRSAVRPISLALLAWMDLATTAGLGASAVH